MKLCKLKLKNLNSFREEVELDFESELLSDASLVAITGPTGAGKTTLLDAICIALYGNTPRLSGRGSQHPRHLISHGEKGGFAEAHFTANGTSYIASWSLKRGSSAEVRLSYAEDNKLISDKLSNKGKALGSSQRTVSEEVESILGLDFDAFRRSVMLAQGEFAAFLKADKEDRRTILEATAGISIYDVLKDKLNEKVTEVEKATADVLDKLNKIPEASQEQLAAAQAQRDRLKLDIDALDAQSQQSQQEKDRETKRKEDYEKLQSSEARQEVLLDMQQEIDVLQVELENARRAERLRPEKQMYDTEKSELAKAEKAFHVATAEKTEAEEQVKTDQIDFQKKEDAYQEASTDRDQKVELYNTAKSDVKHASTQFAAADKRTPDLTKLDNQIDALSDQLNDKQTEHSQLQEKIQATQTFLDENPLPLDRQQRSTRANVLLAQLSSEEKQLEAASTSRAQHEKKVSALKREIEELSKTREERLSEKTEAADILENASGELDTLLSTGTSDEWNTQKHQAAEAQLIAQKYEAKRSALADSEDQLGGLKETTAELDAELVQIGEKLAEQDEICQRAEEAVQHCEDTLKSAMLANPINQLRQHLHAGEPCRVCGATEHPYADIAEPESNEQLRDAEDALASAKSEVQTAQEQMQTLNTERAETKQDRRNITKQIEGCDAEIETLQNEIVQLFTQWQEIYPDADISSEWAAEQVTEADAAIDNLRAAEQARTEASYAYQTASQQLESYENGIKRETETLDNTVKQLQDVSETFEDLREDVASTETRFWELLPDAFHNVTPAEAVEQFGNKMEEVGKRESDLSSAKGDLKLLSAGIETGRDNLENLEKRREALQAEIDGYRREGEAFLEAVREKTGGLETGDAINGVIKRLEADVQTQEAERDSVQQRLQKSQKLFTQKQTAHEMCQDQYEKCDEKLETARQTYFDKLDAVEFDSPEAHDRAFRDEARIQELTAQIDAHEGEKRQLELDIVELKTRFEENLFDSEALERITAQIEKIEAQFQLAQQEVGAQQQKIDDLKRDLKKREALGAEISEAEQELKRWKRLQDTIPRNDLRDFALEIMFKQMGSIANEQLKYLTSERYQLKVEGIGDLTVIDRWNANEERPVETLSGGESFLTSLALALALSELSRGRAQLNSLFLDEGFGTLDAETLDIAIAALEGLRTQGRSIFLISHIQELTRRLPVKINVRKRGDGSSYIGN